MAAIDIVVVPPSDDTARAFRGISDRSGGARQLSMQIVHLPPGANASPHLHPHHETIVYLLSGEVELCWGEQLEQTIVCKAGDFVLTPPNIIHTARNLSDTEPVHLIAARNDPREQEETVVVTVPALVPEVAP